MKRHRLGVVVGILGLVAVSGSPSAFGEDPWRVPDRERRIVGVKIYEPVADLDALIREWHRIGVNTAFISAKLAEDGTFIPAARREGIRTLVVTPVFYNPEHLADHPEDWAVTGRGTRAKDDWVEFVCPSREGYRARRAREALTLLERHRPDGLSLDFIRHFVFWEMVKPDEPIDSLDTSCFCSHCVTRFQRDTSIEVPRESRRRPEAAARWLLAHQREAWLRWRAGLVTSWVRDLARRARRVAPFSWVGIHVVPWGEGDYGDGLMRVAGQDVEALGPLVDYLSPMCYAHMLHRDPSWVARVTRELAGRTRVPVHPSLQVSQAYREDALTDAFFKATLEAALAPPSDGVSFWSWPPLAERESRREMLRRHTR